jgi:hypothetical protein
MIVAPASFQRLMEIVVHGLPNVIVHIADLLLHSAIHEEHLEHLEALLHQHPPWGNKLQAI